LGFAAQEGVGVVACFVLNPIKDDKPALTLK